MANNFMKHIALRVFNIDMRRIDITGHDGKYLDIFFSQGAREAGGIAHLISSNVRFSK